MNQIVGAIFPISAQHASRIFDEGRTVFVKYTKMTKLHKNSKIVFYITGEKRLIGEGVIKNISKIAPDEAWSQYGKNLFLNADEYEKYTSWSPIEGKYRATLVIAVFVLESLRKYKRSPLLSSFTPSGRYISAEDYKKLVSLY